MKPLNYRNLCNALVVTMVAGAYCWASYLSINNAQGKPQLPARIGYVNDFAQVVDDATKQRLENILDGLKKKTGIELNVATVQNTGELGIFSFSRQLAGEWRVGSRISAGKTLLLVVSVDEKTVFTQLSKSVQGELPEGILGELNQRVRGPINTGHFGQGLTDWVDNFIAAIGKKQGFSLQDVDPSQSVASNVSAPVSNATPSPTINNEVTTVPLESAVKRDTPLASRPRIATAPSKETTTEDDLDESEEVELTLTLPLPERINKLKEFLVEYPNSKSKPRAIELLISTYAGLGDQRLKNGDSASGIEQMMLAISEAPSNISDKLFSGVIAQIPLNLFYRGQREAAIEAARKIETKFGTDAKHLVGLAGFYLGIEDGSEASRLANEALKLEPDLAEAHYMLGRGLHISLRLDEAASEYKRALELDPNAKRATRRSLADLKRAAGKAEDALELYREQLRIDPADKGAKAGAVLSLFELGRVDEANKELAATLQEDPRNLAVISGAAYWFAAHNETERSLEMGRQAVQLEPRYTWSQIALARALIDNKRPVDAERALRFARQYGKFPTLDYELASALNAAGLYEEASEVLLQSFSFKDDKIETRLAGRVVTQQSDFIQLLAPERHAAIFQFAAADTKNNAAILKSLLALATVTNQTSDSAKLDETQVAAAAKEFASGSDDMRVYRQLYAAGLLNKKGVALQTAYELAEAARNSIESGLGAPAATIATQAQELRDLRARAIAQGSTPDVADAPREILGNLLLGRVEDTAGWALFNQGKTEAAIEHLKRAAGVLPEGTPLWRTTLWHLGAALDQAGKKTEALDYYIKSYNSGDPDPLRRTVIEQLYQKTNGSLDGLDERISSNRVAENALTQPTTVSTDKPAAAESPSPITESPAAATPEPSPTSPSVAASNPPEAAPTASPSASPEPAVPTPTSPVDNPIPSTASASQPESAPVRTKARVTLKLSGTVRDANNVALSNVVVVLISPRGSVLATTTDTEGNYSFIISPSLLSYRIIPSKEGFVFDPIDRVLTGLSDDQKAIDFTGKGPQKP